MGLVLDLKEAELKAYTHIDVPANTRVELTKFSDGLIVIYDMDDPDNVLCVIDSSSEVEL